MSPTAHAGRGRDSALLGPGHPAYHTLADLATVPLATVFDRNLAPQCRNCRPDALCGPHAIFKRDVLSDVDEPVRVGFSLGSADDTLVLPPVSF